METFKLLKSEQKSLAATVVSQTPIEVLAREWKENKIDKFLGVIAGQE